MKVPDAQKRDFHSPKYRQRVVNSPKEKRQNWKKYLDDFEINNEET